MEPLSYSPEQAERLVGTLEDWPDWNVHEENESKGGQSVQIHIQSSKRADPINSRLAHENTEEEPWDDFEDTEPISDLSPTAPFAASVILSSPKRSTSSANTKEASEALRKDSSKPLKLTSTLRQSTLCKNSSSWDDAWAQEETESQKSQNLLYAELNPAVQQKNGGTGGLGEEFTIKVKKRVHQDPELDLFADMVPDIKLPSSALLPLERNMSDPTPSAAFTENAKSLQVDSSIDTLTLSAKFAAVNMTEVGLWGFILL